jgi:hypothetical protein
VEKTQNIPKFVITEAKMDIQSYGECNTKEYFEKINIEKQRNILKWNMENR